MNNRRPTVDTEKARILKSFRLLLRNPSHQIDRIKLVATNNVCLRYADNNHSIREEALTIAAQENRLDVVKWLIEEMGCKSENIDVLANDPLVISIDNHFYKMTEWLIEQQDAHYMIESVCIEMSILSGNLQALKCLVNNHVPLFIDINENITCFIIRNKQFQILNWLLENHENIFLDNLTGKQGRETQLQLKNYLEKGLKRSEMQAILPSLQKLNLKYLTESLERIILLHELHDSLSSQKNLFFSANRPNVNSLSSSPKKHVHAPIHDFINSEQEQNCSITI